MKAYRISAAAIAMAFGLGFGAFEARATAYTDVTNAWDHYTLSNQTDTWTRCSLVVTNGVAIGAADGSVTEAWFRQTRVEMLNRDTYLAGGFDIAGGTGSRASVHVVSNSYVIKAKNTYVGCGTNSIGELRIVDSTLRENHYGNGNPIYIGTSRNAKNNTAFECTGVMHVVNSDWNQYVGDIYLGGHDGRGELHVTGSRLNISGQLYNWYCGYANGQTRQEAYVCLNASTVTLNTCILGGVPNWGYSRGDMLVTNNSLLRIRYDLTLGHYDGIVYTSSVTVAGSRLQVDRNVLVGGQEYGDGRLVFKDGAEGYVHGSGVILGNKAAGNNRASGLIEVLSGSRLCITNAAQDAALTIGIAGDGHLLVDGGTCRVDRVTVTNGWGEVLLRSGRLEVRNGRIVPRAAPMTVGDGTRSATLALWGGGTLHVGDGLLFKPNAVLDIEIGGAEAGEHAELDVAGELVFEPTASLAVSLVNGFELGADGLVIARADTLTTRPTPPTDEYWLRIIDDNGRRALLFGRERGTLLLLR